MVFHHDRRSLALLLLLLLLSIFSWQGRHNAVMASTANNNKRAPKPDFLSHVDKDVLTAAMEVAKQRHAKAVESALQNYQTDQVVAETAESAELLKSIGFQKYPIEAPGALPDFVDELERAIYVTDPPLFSPEECQSVIQMVEDYHEGKPWSMLPSGQYFISGLWIKDVPPVREWFNTVVRQRLFPLLHRLYPDFCEDPADLCINSAYLFKYTPETGRRTDVHIDNGCLSFTIALNSKPEYEGGGTWFEGLKDYANNGNVLEMKAGQVTLRPAGVKHAGMATEGGARYIIGGFCMNRKKVEYVRQLLTTDPDLTGQENINGNEDQKLLEAALVMNPACDSSYSLLTPHYEKKDKALAKKLLQHGLTYAHPGSGELAYSLGSLSFEEKDFSRTVECMNTCLAMDPFDIDALTTLAEAHSALGQSEQEKTCYERIIQAAAASPKRVASAYCNLGILHSGTDAEIEYYHKSLEMEPNSFAAIYSLAAAHASKGEFDQAIPFYRKAIDVATEEDEAAALRSLYKATTEKLRTEQIVPKTQEEMIQLFQKEMGVDNYHKLAASLRK